MANNKIEQNYYSINITIKDKHLDKHIDQINAYCSLRNYIIGVMDAKCVHFMMIPEFSPEKARMHFHGYFQILDKVKWYKLGCIKRLEKLGFVKIKKIYDMCTWIEYMNKEILITREVLKRQDVEITENSEMLCKQNINIDIWLKEHWENKANFYPDSYSYDK